MSNDTNPNDAREQRQDTHVELRRLRNQNATLHRNIDILKAVALQLATDLQASYERADLCSAIQDHTAQMQKKERTNVKSIATRDKEYTAIIKELRQTLHEKDIIIDTMTSSHEAERQILLMHINTLTKNSMSIDMTTSDRIDTCQP